MDKEKQIILCTKCEGEGVIHQSELTDYHNGHYDHWTETCKKCKGSGRLLKTILTQCHEESFKTPKLEKR